MNIRISNEEREYAQLSPFASHSRDSRGRDAEEEKCQVRTDYQRDRDRILHSRSFRRLKDKTQVFISPQGDHYRTRLTHTLEVSQIARTIARALALNEDLTEAIALGHDLGHTPFGHEGESVLNKIAPGGFVHSEQSVRVVEVLEKEGAGLNLTWEVRDGIRNHRMSGRPSTLEGQVVRLADKIGYIHHDMDDAKHAGIITEEDIPRELRQLMGDTCKDRLNTMIVDLIHNSFDQDFIDMTPEIKDGMMQLRKFMFDNVYSKGVAKQENVKVERLLTALYDYYVHHPESMTAEYRALMENGERPETVVCDYISGMSDLYAIHVFDELYEPHGWVIY